LEQLYKKEKTTGNYGILDQHQAIHWVKQNIKAFGGDPSQLTLFGESSGGQSVLVHYVSPLSEQGFFQRSIIESGKHIYSFITNERCMESVRGDFPSTSNRNGLKFRQEHG